MTSLEVHLTLLGKESIGKSSFIMYHLNGKVQDEYCPTIEDIYFSVVDTDEQLVKIKFIDTPGSEEYSSMLDDFIIKGFTYLILFNFSHESSIQWILDRVIPKLIQSGKIKSSFYVAGLNATDKDKLDKEALKSIQTVLQKLGNCKYFEVSTLNKEEVDKILKEIAQNEVKLFFSKKNTPKKGGLFSSLDDNSSDIVDEFYKLK